ncbi:unnamed protein product [Rhizopus microsporus]
MEKSSVVINRAICGLTLQPNKYIKSTGKKKCAVEALQTSKRRRKLLAGIHICHCKRSLGSVSNRIGRIENISSFGSDSLDCTASTSTGMSMPRLPSKLCTCGDITTSKQQMCINCHIRTSKFKSLTF